ncbi:unnamed protein product [Phytomonas sp. EM1]|nr:unnamed protein product [Phytomonas sp. EM1]|eukprot:CCW61038.1 unnamed protein product [Phytomonas sp. isolate EM1]
MRPVDVEKFWTYCAKVGVVSKKLSFRTSSPPWGPVSVFVDEPVAYGSPIVVVPYQAVLNCQTIRGNRVPWSLPTFYKMFQFLTRRGRMDSETAQCLWLASYLATHHKNMSSSKPLAPLLSFGLKTELSSLFTPEFATSCPFVVEARDDASLCRMDRLATFHVHLAHTMIQFHRRRKGISSAYEPTLHQLSLAYRTVIKHSLPLPINCEPSTPAELAEFMEATPDLTILPSLVPVVDLIRPVQNANNDSTGVEANSAIFTCIQSDFESPVTRRRIVFETTPLSSRRVAVIATKNLKKDDEVILGIE